MADDVYDDDDGLEMFTLGPFTLSRSGDGLCLCQHLPNLAVQRGLILLAASQRTRRIHDAFIYLSSIKAARSPCKISSSSLFLQPAAMQALHYHPFLFALITLVALAELGLAAWLVSSKSLDFPRFNHRYYSM